MSCRSASVLFAVLFLALSPALGRAQGQTATVAGQVLTSSGQPIPGAHLLFRPAAGPDTSVDSDEAGRFETRVAPGEYQIVVTAAGWSALVDLVTIPATGLAPVTYTLLDVLDERVNVVGKATSASRIPGAAQIIEGEEMRKAQIAADDVHQVLRQIPGLNIQEEEGFGLRPNIGMRGTGTDRSSKITMMEDGVLIAPAPYSAPAAYYAPTSGRMEALEVRKGSSQIKHGPLTTGGVLNYVSTSIPDDFRIGANVSGGSFDTQKIQATLGNSYRNFGWLVETFQLRNTGFKELDGGGDTGVDLEDYLAKLRFNTTPSAAGFQQIEIKLGRTDQDGDETYLGLTDADFAINPLRRYAASQVDVFRSTHEQIQARHVLTRRTWDVTTTVYRNDFQRAWYKLENVLGTSLSAVLTSPDQYPLQMAALTGSDTAAYALTVRNNNRTYFGAGVQSIAGTSRTTGRFVHQLEAGIRFHRDEEDRFQQDDRYQMQTGRMILTSAGAPGSQTNQVVGASAVAVFAADTIAWGRWSVAPGLRYETIDLERVDYSRTDPGRAGPSTTTKTGVDAIIPGVGVSYAMSPSVSAFGGVHKGFAPPGPGLSAETRPEESVNYEFGTRITRAGASAEIVGFFNDYSNLLGRDTLSSGGSGEGDLYNGGEARVYGLEASARWIAPLGDRPLTLPVRVAYTFTGTEFRNAFQSSYAPWGTVEVGDEMPYVPRHQLLAGVDVEHARWRGRVDGVFVSRMRTLAGSGPLVTAESTDSTVTVNLSGEYVITGNARLFASVQNVTDRAAIVARHPSGVRPGLPRTLMAGLRVELGR